MPTKGSAEQRVTVGLIGAGGMGTNHLRLLAARKDVDVAYVCDVDRTRLAEAASVVENGAGKAPKAVKDLRHVLDDRGVEAVWIATPDHWHAPGGDPRPGRGQARLRREAVLPQHPRRAG